MAQLGSMLKISDTIFDVGGEGNTKLTNAKVNHQKCYKNLEHSKEEERFDCRGKNISKNRPPVERQPEKERNKYLCLFFNFLLLQTPTLYYRRVGMHLPNNSK